MKKVLLLNTVLKLTEAVFAAAGKEFFYFQVDSYPDVASAREALSFRYDLVIIPAGSADAVFVFYCFVKSSGLRVVAVDTQGDTLGLGRYAVEDLYRDSEVPIPPAKTIRDWVRGN